MYVCIYMYDITYDTLRENINKVEMLKVEISKKLIFKNNENKLNNNNYIHTTANYSNYSN